MSEPFCAELADAIAVIGLAVRAPGAPDAAELWRVVEAGRVTTGRWSREALLRDGWSEADLDRPEFVHASGALDGIDRFDAAFFDCSPAEAARMDPQHRIFLECAWQALEDAGCDPARTRGRIGVFGGCGTSGYALPLLSEGLMSPANLLSFSVGTVADFLTMRVSYKLGLRGPSIGIQTACSTSLVAVHVAALHLLAGQCEVALAGGVTLRTFQRGGYLYEDGSILSPDGTCAPFDAGARGTVEGDGVGVVVLKRLEDAWRDRDPIRAVIRGTAINNDGAAKVGFTAPSVDGQAAVIRDALAMADVAPDTIGYVEGHGTATPIGDPIEVAALARVFGADRANPARRVLGSVKGNLGHLDTAAGVVGLIKTVLALEHRVLPPTANFRRLNPHCEPAGAGFQVLTEPARWEVANAPRRAGVSSFGMGGTNAHVVLEEAPAPPGRAAAVGHHLLLVSARAPDALQRSAQALAAHLASHPGLDLRDVAFTLRHGRRAFAHRRAVVCDDLGGAALALAAPDDRGGAPIARPDRPVVFAFSGQGAQHPGMGRGLYQAEPVFRRAIDRCCELLAPHLGGDLRSMLFAPGSSTTAETLAQTRWTQPAVFALEVALAELLDSWGIRPQAMIGHSLGEYAAACWSGVFSLEDAVALVAQRGALMQALPPGAMLAVAAPAAELDGALPEAVAIAAINGASRSVVSGEPVAIAEVERSLAARGVASARLATSHAFHSAMMDPILAPFEAAVGRVRRAPPRIPVISNVTGDWLGAEAAVDPGYWVSHLRRTVQFARGLATVAATLDAPIILEVGPGTTLTRLARGELPASAGDAIAMLDGERATAHEQVQALRAAGELWARGAGAELGFAGDADARRVSLPSYPFDRKRYWIGGLPASPGDLRRVEVERTGERGAPAAADPAPAAAARDDAGIAREVEAIFASLLGRDDIRPSDSFFELGGDSLLGIQLVARLRAQLGATIALADVFRAPTIADLTRGISARRAPTGGEPAVAAPAGPLPLTCAQEGLWIIEQLTPGTSVHHLTQVLQLVGPLDVAALERALGRIVQRHEPLRTGFEIDDGHPVARVHAAVAFAVQRTSAAAFEPAAARRIALERASEAARAPFDLRRPPLVRATLVDIGIDEHLLALTFHHLVADGWSFGVLVRELARGYDQADDDRAPAGASYAAYALEERAWLDTAEAREAREFWARQLSAPEPPEPLDLPLDRPRPAAAVVAGASHAFELSDATRRSIERCARGEDTTPFVVLLAAFATVLGRMADTSDVALGVPVANRARPELEPLIGMFVNTVVYRLRADPAATVRDHLRRVRDQHFEVLQRQRYPFEKVVEAVQPQRDLSWNPLFQAMFSFEGEALETLTLGPLQIASVELTQDTSQFDLALAVAPRAGGYHARIQYASDLLDVSTVVRIEHRLRAVLDAFAGEPERPLRSIEIEPAVHEAPAPRIEPVPAVAAAPAAERAARALEAMRLPREGAIGLGGAPSTELLRAALTTLSAGWTLTLADAAAPAAVLGGSDWPGDARIARIALDAVAELGTHAPVPLPAPSSAIASRHDGPARAWLRTGRELAAHAAAVAHALDLRRDDHLLTMLALEPALACAALPAAAAGARFTTGTADSWGSVLARAGELAATIAIAPLEIWNRWADELARRSPGAIPAALRAVVSVGRTPSPGRAAQFLKRTRGRLTWIHVVEVDRWPVATLASTGDALAGAPRRLAHLAWDVRGRDDRPTPVQSVGTLHVTGFGAPDGARDSDGFAATGHRAKRRADGGVEILGSHRRVARVGGFRVSLDAIEDAVAALPGVAEVAVVRPDIAGGAPTALVVPLAGRVVSGAELRRQISARVPACMVPECHVRAALPRLPSGEVDPAAVAALRAASPAGGEPPRDDLERALVEIWQRVLRVDRVGIHDNVFSLGADSLLAVRFVAEAERRGLSIGIRDIFQHQTVALLRAIATTAPAPEHGAAAATEIPLAPTQARILAEPLGAPARYSRSLLVALAQPLDRAAFQAALAHVVQTHEALRVRFARSADRWIQRIEGDLGELPFQVLAASELAGRSPGERLVAATERVHAGIQLDGGAPWSVAEIDAGDGRSRLFFAFHALVLDAVSWSTVLGDLELAYRQACAGDEPRIPPPRVPWSQAVTELVALAHRLEAAGEADAWAARLVRPAALLPADDRGPNDEASQRAVERSLAPEDTAWFVGGGDRAPAGEAALAAALVRALAPWAGARDVLVALGRHGRPALGDRDLARTAGAFVTDVPIWLSATADPRADFERAAAELRSLAHGGIDLAWLREHAASACVRRELARLPVPQVSLDYLGQPLLDASPLFTVSREATAADRAPRLPRTRMFHVIAHLEAGLLRVEWRYSENLHRRATVEHLVERFLDELRAILRLR